MQWIYMNEILQLHIYHFYFLVWHINNWHKALSYFHILKRTQSSVPSNIEWNRVCGEVQNSLISGRTAEGFQSEGPVCLKGWVILNKSSNSYCPYVERNSDGVTSRKHLPRFFPFGQIGGKEKEVCVWGGKEGPKLMHVGLNTSKLYCRPKWWRRPMLYLFATKREQNLARHAQKKKKEKKEATENAKKNED